MSEVEEVEGVGIMSLRVVTDIFITPVVVEGLVVSQNRLLAKR